MRDGRIRRDLLETTASLAASVGGFDILCGTLSDLIWVDRGFFELKLNNLRHHLQVSLGPFSLHLQVSLVSIV